MAAATTAPVPPVRAAARVLALVILVVVVAAGCSAHSKPSVGASVSVFHLKVGDCLVPPTAVKAEITSVKVVEILGRSARLVIRRRLWPGRRWVLRPV